MSDLFKRDGSLLSEAALSFDAKGKPSYTEVIPCNRCHVVNGQRVWLMGIENGRPYSRTGFECWTCGNTGIRKQAQRPAYSAEQLARLNRAEATREATKQKKLDEALAALAAKREAFKLAHAGLVALLGSFEGDFWKRFRESFYARCEEPTERQLAIIKNEQERVAAKAAAPISQAVGAIGARVEMTLLTEHSMRLESDFGPLYLYIMIDAAGNRIVYKGSSTAVPCKGEKARVLASIKEHREYRGVMQTIIARPKLIENIVAN